MGLLGSIVGGIAGIGQSLIDARNQRRNVDMTNQANMNLAQYQYSKDLEMWNRANEYNSPSAQMARFQQAGLNPNLIYGGSVSGASGNTATSLPKFQAPQLSYNYKSPMNLLTMLSEFQNFNIKQAQTDNLRAIADRNKSLANVERAIQGEKIYKWIQDSAKSGYQMTNENLRMIINNVIADTERDYRNSQILKNQADASRTITDKAIRDIQLNFMKRIGMTDVGRMLSSVLQAASLIKR